MKVPKGFENFFPKGAMPRKKKKKESASTTNNNKVDEDHETTDGERGSATRDRRTGFGSKNNNKKKKSNSHNSNHNNGDQQPPQEQVGAMLAFLLLFLAFRSIQESDVKNGSEITWHDFRTHLINDTKKLVVVNKNLVRVHLKEGARGMPTTNSGTTLYESQALSSPTAVQVGSEDWNDGTEMDLGSSSIDANDASNHQLQHRRDNNHHVYHFFIGSVDTFEEKLTNAQQEIGIQPRDYISVNYVTETDWAKEIIRASPWMFIMGLFIWGLLQNGSVGAAGRGGGIFQIGKSNAKKINKEDVNVTFADVAGCQEAKKEIMEFVDFLQDSSRFTKLGAKIPKGALLCGPPGTGKTLLAKAVAGEAGVPFYSISGSDFLEMFVGVGPSRVRDLFKEARASAPCIIFIDEIDAVGRQRGRGGFGGGNDERENTLNQLLVEMDGFSPSTGVVVLAGTNRIDILDSALTRPGRFDRQIQVDRPDLQGRKEIFQVHLKGITLAGTIDEIAGRLAGLTPGFAGADIANICNEAAIVAARRKGESVTLEDFEKATDRIIGGLESTKIMSDEERSIVAFHEAGHAVAGWFLEHCDPVLKVTIIPRTSGALGFAQYLPKEIFLRSQDQIMDTVCMALAGRAAEEVFFGNVTTGASDDLRRVTQMVYSTIKDYGMNSRVGQLSFPRNESGMPADKPYSDATAQAIDEEARSIVDAAYQRTLDLIRERKTEVEQVALRLLERETITHDDIVDLVGPRPFEGDEQYKQYVSSRHVVDQSEPAMEEEEKKEEDLTDGVLSPGLA